MSRTSHLPLFGGPRAWSEDEWTSSDDRVRGGKSHSALTCSPGSLVARFHGNLDITALGGAGFASQRTTDDIHHNDNKHHKHRKHHHGHDGDGDDGDNPKPWDLSYYDGLELVIDRADSKTYTLTLKNDILPRRPDGREQSTLSWEYDFRADSINSRNDRQGSIFVRWDEFRPTYRGKQIPDAKPLDLARIRRFAIMVRSFFGEQEGDFSLHLVSISARRTERYCDDTNEKEYVEILDEKTVGPSTTKTNRACLAWLGGCLGLCDD